MQSARMVSAAERVATMRTISGGIGCEMTHRLAAVMALRSFWLSAPARGDAPRCSGVA